MKKLLLVILCLFMLIGCGKKEEPPVGPTPSEGDITCKISNENHDDSVGVEYLNKLKNFKVREKNKNNTVDNAEFNAFLDRVFKDSVESSYLYMHNSVVDYKAMGLEKPEPKFGEIKYDDPDIEDLEKQLEELLSFDYNSLSYSQQYNYDLFEYSLYESLADSAYGKYSFLYSSSVDAISNMITNLTDFVFHDKEEVEDFITLIKDAKRYIGEIKQFTVDQIADGIYMSDDMANNTLELLDRFLANTDNNALITSFDNRIDALDFLTSEEKENYKSQNKEIVLNDILPELEDTREYLNSLIGNLEDPRCLALHNLSENYAELTYILMGSYNLPIDEIYNRTYDLFIDLDQSYVDAYRSGKMEEYDEILKNPQGVFALNSAREILDYLKDNLGSYYPSLGEVEYDVAEIDASSANASTVAYYWSAPLDQLNQNLIRTNPNILKDDLIQTYTTLAHEGFPGHLYQHVYFQRTNPHRFRNTQSFIGYTEGYAVRAQFDAMRFANIAEDPSEEVLDMMAFDSMFYFPLYSLFDIAINYYGYDETAVGELLNDLGYNPASASNFISLLTEMPGVYCSYGLGFTHLTNLREKAMEELGDKFDIVKFNDVILSCGESPFPLVEQRVNEYIADNK